MASITAAQIRKIYVTAREYGMDNDLLHIHIQTVTGKESLKELNKSEAIQVIDSLERRSQTNDARRMTTKQFGYIKGLMKKIGWVDEKGEPDLKRLDGFCYKRFSVGSHKWLTPATASNVIEGLKNMIKNQEDVP